MSWTLFAVPATKRTELDEVLKDDSVARQSQKVRDAATAGGKAGELFVLVEGSDGPVQRAEGLLGKVGSKLPGPEAERVYRQFKDEEENAASGMGLFFTE